MARLYELPDKTKIMAGIANEGGMADKTKSGTVKDSLMEAMSI
jgi:hypothetical protein